MSVRIEGLQAVLRIFDRLIDASHREKLGAVFSTGANQGRGRYEHYVQGHGTQAEIHQGRWSTDRDIAEKREDDSAAILEQGIAALIQGRAGGVTSAVDRILDMLLEDAQTYPPRPSGSRYIRTGTLRASWVKERLI